MNNSESLTWNDPLLAELNPFNQPLINEGFYQVFYNYPPGWLNLRTLLLYTVLDPLGKPVTGTPSILLKR